MSKISYTLIPEQHYVYLGGERVGTIKSDASGSVWRYFTLSDGVGEVFTTLEACKASLEDDS